MTGVELRTILAAHAAWARKETGGVRANLYGANLHGANLSAADLRGADLTRANLTRATLIGADLYGAYLTCATLRDAVLTGADLHGANLHGADLRDANLRGANLSDAYLTDAVLISANLRDADLSRSDLTRVDLYNADLTGTCLDPDAAIPAVSDAEILSAGLEIDGDLVRGWRTRQSIYVGSTVYEPGTVHVAPWFSIAQTTCHPGLYMSGRAYIAREHAGKPIVACHCMRSELHHVGEKWRCKRLWIDEEVTT